MIKTSAIQLRREGEAMFRCIVEELNRLQPGRVRTEEEFEQICISLALFQQYLERIAKLEGKIG